MRAQNVETGQLLAMKSYWEALSLVGLIVLSMIVTIVLNIAGAFASNAGRVYRYPLAIPFVPSGKVARSRAAGKIAVPCEWQPTPSHSALVRISHVQLAPYLFFDGTCSQALELYKTVFGGTTEVTLYKDLPPDGNAPMRPPEAIMHATFTAPGMTFMASDGRVGENYAGGRISMSIATDVESGTEMFAALSDGATDVMPPAEDVLGRDVRAAHR